MGGNFQQTLPIVPKGSREDILDTTITRSYLWHDINVIHLHQNMWLRDDPEADSFSKWLLKIGHGENIDENNEVEIPSDMRTTDTNSLMHFVYPNLELSSQANPPPANYFLQQIILAPQNSNVNVTNEILLDKMPGNTKIYYSANNIIHEPGADHHRLSFVPPEFFCSIQSPSLPPGDLKIKIGCPIILLWNLSPSKGLCNGSRMTVVNMSERVLHIHLIGGDHDGQLALIPRICLIPTSTPNFAFKFKCLQFPVRLAFVITINKAQGQSVLYIGVDICIPVFAHSQLYVALSRVTTKQNIKVLLPSDNTNSKTTNVLF